MKIKGRTLAAAMLFMLASAIYITIVLNKADIIIHAGVRLCSFIRIASLIITAASSGMTAVYLRTDISESKRKQKADK